MRPGIRIGVDVGSVRVGVAACDAGGILATPVATLARGTSAQAAAAGITSEGRADPGGSGDTSIDALAALVQEMDAMEVIVGLPRSLSGEEGPSAGAARSYAQQLAARLRPVPVRLVDERLTTVYAHRALYTSGRTGLYHRQVVDQVAAVMILQGALDAERESGREPGERVGGRKPRHRKGRA